MNAIFSLNNISKYRQELMGMGILGVLVGHIVVMGALPEFPMQDVVGFLCGIVHTTGFLFLSGYGIYFSLSKNDDTKAYFRRFYRFYLPFLILATPFWSAVMIFKHENIWFLLRCLSTAEFWFNGNYMGMWYIAITFALYILTPTVYSIIKEKKILQTSFIIIFLIGCIIAANIALEHYNLEYYNLIAIGIKKVPFYFEGLLFAVFVQQLKQEFNKSISMVLVVMGAILIVTEYFHLTLNFEYIVKPAFIIALTTIMALMTKYKIGSWVTKSLRWFGKYSLELYILHLYIYGVVGIALHHGSLFNITVGVLFSIILCVPVHTIIDKVVGVVKLKLNKTS